MSEKPASSRSHDAKASVDLALMVLLVVLVCRQAMGDVLHEWLGMAFFVLLVVHNVLNLRWWRMLRRGGWRPVRVAQTAVGVACVALAVATCVTALGVARYLPFSAHLSASVVPRLHLGLAAWMFVLMSVHVGQCVWPMMSAELAGHGHVPRSRTSEEVRHVRVRTLSVCVALAVAGVWALAVLGLGSHLAFQATFVSLGMGMVGAAVVGLAVLGMVGLACVGVLAQACSLARRLHSVDIRRGPVIRP